MNALILQICVFFFVCVPINLIVDKIIQFLFLRMVLDWKCNRLLKIHNIFIYTSLKNVKKKKKNTEKWEFYIWNGEFFK